jgi:hypothetical protein
MRPTRRLCAALLAAGLAVGGAGAARAFADDGGEGGDGSADSIAAQIQAQMRKIVKLMRENEGALLTASRGGGGKPAGVPVKPPEGEAATPPRSGDGTGGAPPATGGAGPSAGQPGQAGEDAQKRLDELLKASAEEGKVIPKELEELVRMIPT